MHTWHDKNIKSNAPYRSVFPTQLNHFASFAKQLSVRLRTKWFWVRFQLQSLHLQISRLLRARSYVTEMGERDISFRGISVIISGSKSSYSVLSSYKSPLYSWNMLFGGTCSSVNCPFREMSIGNYLSEKYLFGEWSVWETVRRWTGGRGTVRRATVLESIDISVWGKIKMESKNLEVHICG